MSFNAGHEQEYVKRLVDEFLPRYYEEDLAELVEQYPREMRSLTIDYMDLWRFDSAFTDDVRAHPREFLSYLEEAVKRYDFPVDMSFDDVTVRIANLPDSHAYDVGAYRSRQIGHYIGVEGQVAKLSEVKPKPEILAYECQRCGTVTTVPQSDDGIQEPHECEGCERQGPFALKYDRSEFVDHQLLRLQRPPEQTKGGDGATVDVHLEGDAVGELQAGDRVQVGGVMAIEEPGDGQVAFDPYINGRGVTVEQTDYSDIDVDDHLEDILALASGERGDPYELLVDSLAPKIQGMRELKEALILQTFGGVRVAYPDGSHDRGDPHILLLGDPGTAKSSLLEQVENLAPRSTYSSGKGATAAGMTAAAQQDDFGSSEWSLEAGALVLADQGIACVDEIDKVRDDAVDSMHEALSKQQVHVNKAGINARLPTRTALLAAGNPSRGRFDQHEPIADQIDLGPAMLSRFDLLFMIDDQPDEERDREIVDGMIESRALACAYTDDSTQVDADALSNIEPAVPTETIRAWVAHAKETSSPRIRDDAVREELRDSFTSLRMANGSGADQPVPVTFRKLEGIERLAEASARVRLSDEVEMQDIERARRLIGRSMRDVGMDPENGQFDADIVETGESQSQKDRRDAIETIVDELDRETGAGAPTDDVIEQATDAGFDRTQVKYDLKKLKKQGELYEPQTGNLRTT